MTADAGVSVSMRDEITALVEERLGITVPAPDTDLVDEGLIDSLALVTLIVALEDTFGRELPLADFDIEHFRTIEKMAAFVASA